MSTAAWPFLVGRSRNSGHRVIVAPDFMKNADEADRLGWLARGETGHNEALMVEIRGLAEGPATAIFRVFRARESHYFGEGAEPLTDSAGRPIRMTEGIVVRRTRAETASLPFTTADLAMAHQLLVPAFCDFWRHEKQYSLQYSASFPAGGATSAGSPLEFRTLSREGDKPPQPEPARAPRYNEPPAVVVRKEEPARRNWRLIASIVGLACITFAVTLGIYSLISSPSAPDTKATPSPVSSVPAGSATSTLKTLCRELATGKIDAVYLMMTPALRTTMPENTFRAELLAGNAKADSCRTDHFTMSGPSARTARLVIITGTKIEEYWSIGLVKHDGKWMADSLSMVSING